MNNSENTECTHQVVEVDEDDDGVHLVLLHEAVGIVYQLNVGLACTFVVIVENFINWVEVGLTRKVKLNHEANDNQ